MSESSPNKLLALTESVQAKSNAVVEKVLGFVGNRPWENWLDVTNKFIVKFLPLAILVAGVLAFLTGLIGGIRFVSQMGDAFSFGEKVHVVVAPLLGLIVTFFSMLLSAKAFELMESVIKKYQVREVRPELFHILKVLLGGGLILFSVYGILEFTLDSFICAIIFLIVSVLLIIVFSNPGIVGLKFGYPVSGIQEVVTLVVFFPIRFVLALLHVFVGLVVVAGIGWGIVSVFMDGIQANASIPFGVAVVVPFCVPVAVFALYLVISVLLLFLKVSINLYRAIVALPRKLDELKK